MEGVVQLVLPSTDVLLAFFGSQPTGNRQCLSKSFKGFDTFYLSGDLNFATCHLVIHHIALTNVTSQRNNAEPLDDTGLLLCLQH